MRARRKCTTDVKEHDARIRQLLQRFSDHNVRLKKEKCKFSESSLRYLGHIVDKTGIRPLPEKVEAILKAPVLDSKERLASFLGLVNYYGKFIPQLASMAAPLYALNRKDVDWKWTKQCNSAFEKLKSALTSKSTLIHYDSSLPLGLDCDASSYGVGAVLFHYMPDGTQRPVAFASQTLSKSERNYSQIEREAWALIYGVKHFHRYLYGRKFDSVTDHLPLLTVLGPKGHIASVSASRLHRWATILLSYDFRLKFRPSKAHGNADYLSRNPLPTGDCLLDDDQTAVIAALESSMDLPVTFKQVRTSTLRDKELTQVLRYIQSGWPSKVSDCQELSGFYVRRQELYASNGCIFWGLRLIIPRCLRPIILNSLHEGHFGIVRMKALARSYVWWPGIDLAVENLAKSCVSCAEQKAAPGKVPVFSWAYPERPWQRLHMDFCGPVDGQQWLIIVDAYSKWPEAIAFSKFPDTALMLVHLRSVFSRFGISEIIVTDNASIFTSQEFTDFCSSNGIHHKFSAPYHPATNGEAERFVGTFKKGMHSSQIRDWRLKAYNFLLQYRTTPHAATGKSPSELIFGRTIRTKWDLLRSSNAVKEDGKMPHRSIRTYDNGDLVWARNYRPGAKWVPGEVKEVLGPRNLVINTTAGLWKRHLEQLHPRSLLNSSTPVVNPDLIPSGNQLNGTAPIDNSPSTPISTPVVDSPASSSDGFVSAPSTPVQIDSTPKRYPGRLNRKPPDRWGYKP